MRLQAPFIELVEYSQESRKKQRRKAQNRIAQQNLRKKCQSRKQNPSSLSTQSISGEEFLDYNDKSVGPSQPEVTTQLDGDCCRTTTAIPSVYVQNGGQASTELNLTHTNSPAYETFSSRGPVSVPSTELLEHTSDFLFEEHYMNSDNHSMAIGDLGESLIGDLEDEQALSLWVDGDNLATGYDFGPYNPSSVGGGVLSVDLADPVETTVQSNKPNTTVEQCPPDLRNTQDVDRCKTNDLRRLEGEKLVATIRGETCLHIAARKGYTNIVVSLLNLGAGVDERCSKGMTALHHASKEGHVELIPLLLHYGADANSLDNQGCTPLHIAVYNRQDAIISSLAKGGADISIRTKDS